MTRSFFRRRAARSFVVLPLALLALAQMAFAADGVTFFVAPNGDDAGTGKIDRPFMTPARARDAVRELKKQGGGKLGGPVTVDLRGGTYYLSEPLVLTPEDSGANDGAVTYAAHENEKPVLSGGRPVTGWAKQQLNGREVWAAKAPWLAEPSAPPLRSLWVNGKRGVRARSPNFGKGFFKVAEVPEATGDWMKGVTSFKFAENDLKNWPGLKGGGAEVMVMSRWVESRVPVTSVDEAARTVRFGKPSVWVVEKDDRYWVEGAPELLDEPGEWCFDRASATLYYLPRGGEEISKIDAVVPAISQVVRLEGKPGEGKYVEHVVFRGVGFSHTGWNQGWPGADAVMNNRSGFSQAAVGVPGAVHGEGVRSCVFDHCTFAHLGTYALELSRGCQNNRVAACTMTDLGAGGVKIGETRVRADKADQSFGNEVSDSRIIDAGNEFPSAIGVWIGQSYDNRISHNEIADLYYSALSVGWTWGYGEASARGNVIEHNHVHHVGRPADEPEPILSDMAGIYTLGKQSGTVIRHNRFHDVAGIKYGGWGIYYDEGTSDVVSENNVVYRTTHGGFHQHYGKDNVFRNNIIAFGRDMQAQRTRPEPHQSFTFEHNIVYWDKGDAVVGGWDNYNVAFDHNVYWRTDGKSDFRLGNLPLEQWRQKGLDVHSVVADPKFVDPTKDDFNLQGDSPAIKAGFKPFDQADVGPRAEARAGR
jgi:hypothetical protein